jgi:hypothetical protein
VNTTAKVLRYPAEAVRVDRKGIIVTDGASAVAAELQRIHADMIPPSSVGGPGAGVTEG